MSTWSNGGTTAFSSASDTATLTLDYTPPRVTVTSPSLTGGTLAAGTASLAFNFSETVVGAGTAANYQLESAGPDGLLGTADDVIVPLAVSYSGGWATLTFSPLPENVYRLTADDTITDVAGNNSTATATVSPAAIGPPISWQCRAAACWPAGQFFRRLKSLWDCGGRFQRRRHSRSGRSQQHFRRHGPKFCSATERAHLPPAAVTAREEAAPARWRLPISTTMASSISP